MSLIYSQDWDGVTAPAIPTDWNVDTEYETSSTPAGGITPISNPNVLAFVSANNVDDYATWNTLDGNSGNVAVQADFNCLSVTSHTVMGLTARASATPIVRTSSTFYRAYIDLAAGQGNIDVVQSGTITNVATQSTGSLTSGVWYQFTFTLSGPSLSLTVQRLSDSYWLNSTGSFQSAAATFLTGMDSNISGQGYSGIYEVQRAGDTYSDNFSLSTAPALVVIVDSDSSLMSESYTYTLSLFNIDSCISTESQFGSISDSDPSSGSESGSSIVIILDIDSSKYSELNTYQLYVLVYDSSICAESQHGTRGDSDSSSGLESGTSPIIMVMTDSASAADSQIVSALIIYYDLSTGLQANILSLSNYDIDQSLGSEAQVSRLSDSDQASEMESQYVYSGITQVLLYDSDSATCIEAFMLTNIVFGIEPVPIGEVQLVSRFTMSVDIAQALEDQLIIISEVIKNNLFIQYDIAMCGEVQATIVNQADSASAIEKQIQNQVIITSDISQLIEF